ncbi:molybdenum cofactor guanylyltransferase [Aquibacillus sediminis]|uniref:molybdenum cofactor guanylyltransferase n=1 Tax=Aquibacillus sediminis TaxID=2574734 RepID=UPI001486EAD9|nr:molybdenum cofactor guanylyltransferase [Aquibacillus sediminis]
MVSNSVVGIILAGGRSRRFGTPKAFAKKNNIPFYQYSLQVIQTFTSSVIIVTNPNLHQSFKQAEPDVQIIDDLPKYRRQGPAAGIYSAMDTLAADWYMVIPIDVPFVQVWVMQRLMKYTDRSYDAIVPVVNGKQQPLIALYQQTAKKQIARQLDHGKRSLKDLLSSLRVKYVPFDDEHPFININHQQEYRDFVEE